jgi:SsrA-binding protein
VSEHSRCTTSTERAVYPVYSAGDAAIERRSGNGPAFVRSAISNPYPDPTMPEAKTITLTRRARHEFTIDDTVEAGIVLFGTEIKSIRAGQVSLSDAFARIDRGEAWLVGAHIAPWEGGNRENHEPKRNRKLLLHRRQIDELLGKAKAKGLTIVPLRLYISDRGKAKLEIGLGRGKQLYDRRREIAARDARRDMDRDLADAQRSR